MVASAAIFMPSEARSEAEKVNHREAGNYDPCGLAREAHFLALVLPRKCAVCLSLLNIFF